MIGLFDSGYGGLSILRSIRERLPEYDYLFLGDNARAPYGPRSFEVVYRYTLESVCALFERGCRLVILACNTASAKALRTIQQHDLPRLDPTRRVLGVIRPTVEAIGTLTQTRHVGILATQGTIASGSYSIEIAKLWPDVVVRGQACPMWVPLVENYEFDTPGADYFVEKRIRQILAADPLIDTLVLACTHYPHLLPKIRRYTPEGIRIVAQGDYVAASLAGYLQRHPEMDATLSKGGTLRCLTTEEPSKFHDLATLFMRQEVEVEAMEPM